MRKLGHPYLRGYGGQQPQCRRTPAARCRHGYARRVGLPAIENAIDRASGLGDPYYVPHADGALIQAMAPRSSHLFRLTISCVPVRRRR